MAQNDTHVALIILTTQIWGGEIIGGKNFFGPNFVFLCLWRQHPFLHKTKGPTWNPISPTPPPLLRRASMSPPPPPPQSNFQVAQRERCQLYGSSHQTRPLSTPRSQNTTVPTGGLRKAGLGACVKQFSARLKKKKDVCMVLCLKQWGTRPKWTDTDVARSHRCTNQLSPA